MISIFYVYTSETRYELKVVLPHLCRVNVKTIRGFINILLADFFIDKLRHNNITSCTDTVDRPRQFNFIGTTYRYLKTKFLLFSMAPKVGYGSVIN